MISAAEALEKSRSSDGALLPTFMYFAEEAVKTAASFGKREAYLRGVGELAEHMQYVSPTFLAIEETLQNLGYTVTRSVTSHTPCLIIRW